ncbi:MAG TPA: hypothetical protein PKD99_01455 [Sphingopyxis sp.]|nr:hypothetical protein [Sphingopyxis sp.]HMP43742.1 hypothetical protein [Sphingopyxis sp.]
MPQRAWIAFVAEDVETAQPFRQLLCDFPDGGMAPPPVWASKIIEQRLCGSRNGDLKVEGQGFFIDSGHSCAKRTN